MTFEWNKASYEQSITTRTFWYTPYDDGWDNSHIHGMDLREDMALHDLIREEMELRPFPDWVTGLAQNTIANIPPCGHHTFPTPYLRVLDAIGREQANDFNYCCYTASADRKREAMDYCLCLDGWLAGANATAMATELNAQGFLQINWDQACANLWSILGERTICKELLIERTLLQLRWWIKTLIWPDDLATNFGRDQFLGTYHPTGSYATDNGNPQIKAPMFDLSSSPAIQRLENQLDEQCKNWPEFRRLLCEVDGINLCAPKTFRFLEKFLYQVGRERPLNDNEKVPAFLQSDATYPNQDEAAQWWKEFMAQLNNWQQDKQNDSPMARDIAQRLGTRTPIKTWLVRLYTHRLELHETCAEINRLIHPKSDTMRGSKRA